MEDSQVAAANDGNTHDFDDMAAGGVADSGSVDAFERAEAAGGDMQDHEAVDADTDMQEAGDSHSPTCAAAAVAASSSISAGSRELLHRR